MQKEKKNTKIGLCTDDKGKRLLDVSVSFLVCLLGNSVAEKNNKCGV
jgi:hypothetical protein